MLSAMQLAMNTCDMPGSLRLYSEVFGFVNGGGQGLWGETIRIQGLAPSDRAILWWMCGAQPFFQLEFYTHTAPVQRPLPADWRPCDLGWVRCGLGVANLDAALAALPAFGITALGRAGRRAAFRDPFSGVMVEMIEGEAATALYATSSVSDLEAARVYYRDVIGLPILPLEQLHQPEDEALWGLAGAQRTGFLADAGTMRLEILCYTAPRGRPRPADARASDQGIPNVALGTRHREEAEAVFARLKAAGHVPPHLVDNGAILGGYIVDAERELELGALPEELDGMLGFRPAMPFIASL